MAIATLLYYPKTPLLKIASLPPNGNETDDILQYSGIHPWVEHCSDLTRQQLVAGGCMWAISNQLLATISCAIDHNILQESHDEPNELCIP